jgi:non-specific serine/threonine protein kinase
MSEVRMWLGTLLSPSAEIGPAARLMGLVDLGWAALLQGDHEAAKDAVAASIAVSFNDSEVGPIAHAAVLDMRAIVAMNTDDAEVARPLLEEALGRCRGVPGGERMTVWITNHLGLVDDVKGNSRAALARYEEALALVAPDDDALRLLTIGNMVAPVEALGDRRRAADLARLNAALLRRVPAAYLAMYALWDSADFAAMGDDHVQAARLIGAAERVQQEAGFAIALGGDEEINALFARVREALGEADYTAAHAEGRALSLDAALAEAEDASAAAVAREDEASR